MEIYEPWSVSKYINDRRNRSNPFPQPYWTNTFSENILRDMVENADNETKNDMEILLNSGAIEKQMHRDITYEDLHQSREHLWNFLLFAGYLHKIGERMIGHQRYMSMEIPNKEIKKLYADPFTQEDYPDVQKYAISFYKKECMVKKGTGFPI